MALREYTDPTGTTWTVWNVPPRYTPVRSGLERRRQQPATPLPERRRLPDRRRHSTLTPGLERGWLCFESPAEKRRLIPVPTDWEGCPPTRLEHYRRLAAAVRRSGAS